MGNREQKLTGAPLFYIYCKNPSSIKRKPEKEVCYLDAVLHSSTASGEAHFLLLAYSSHMSQGGGAGSFVTQGQVISTALEQTVLEVKGKEEQGVKCLVIYKLNLFLPFQSARFPVQVSNS